MIGVRLSFFEPTPLDGHQLLDSGAGMKLERFGDVTLVRPDPQALWSPRLGPREWEAAHLVFERESDRGGSFHPSPDAPAHARGKGAQWECAHGAATFLIRPTAFKHVGLFPEQATNWTLVQEAAGSLRNGRDEPPRLLNLFGYSGAASILAAQAGYAVTHVDASKQAIAWTRDNLAASSMADDSLRLLCDDALAFVRREGRRGSRYAAVLLDPPHHGRGPKGESWQLERDLGPLLEAVAPLLEERALCVLSAYAVGYSVISMARLMEEHLGVQGPEPIQAGELVLREGDGERILPAGLCVRWQRGLHGGA
jgi:23S rRNA (cytosine1962-C5)-methyltransferase